MRLKYILSLLLLSALFWSCQCVIGIETPKEVSPTFFSHILFINAHPEFDELNILTDENVLVKSLYYNVNPKSYTSVSPGSRNIQITNYQDSVLFNSVSDLVDNQKYTFIAYGNSKRVQSIFFNDTISNFQPANMYYRVVDVSPDSPPFIIKLEDQYPIYNNINFRSATKYISAPAGSYNIEVKEAVTDSLVLSLKKYEMSAGKVYTILIKGNYMGEGSKKMQFQIIENDFTAKTY